jgi:preprotein translocase subunit YajC
MNIATLAALLAFAPQQQSGTQPNPTGSMLQMFGTFAILGVMFYFVLIRPQQKKAREHADLVKTMKPGDRVLTSGGIVGTVVNIKEKTISIRSADTKLEILRSAVSEITERGVASTES